MLGRNTRIKVLGGEILFRFESTDGVDFKRRLGEYKKAAKDMTPVFADFHPIMLRSIQRNFDAQGRPRRWVDLEESTIRQRIREGYGAAPILVRSGKMQRGWRGNWTKRTYRLRNVAKSRRGYPYAEVHQYGSRDGRTPARPMALMQPQDKAQMTRLIRKHFGVE